MPMFVLSLIVLAIVTYAPALVLAPVMWFR
jgi:hypothetical protein